MQVKKGDNVQIMAGKDKGKKGKILEVDPKNQRVLVEGVNVYKKHQRPKRQGEKGEIVTLSRPLRASNVMLVCSSCGNAVRTGHRVENEKKTRYCKKCNANT